MNHNWNDLKLLRGVFSKSGVKGFMCIIDRSKLNLKTEKYESDIDL